MKAKNIAKNTLKGLLVILIIIGVILMSSVMLVRMSGNTPSLFGYQFYVIASPSMEPELSVGDIIISEKYTDQQIENGDIITFLGREGSLNGKVVTHQVVDVKEINGELSITTKGLANNIEDPSITSDDVLSIMKYKTVAFGFVYQLISSTPGFILLILLPLLALIASEIYNLAKVLHSDENNDNNREEGDADNDEKQNV